MKAEKLPSGSWRVRVNLGTVNGKAVRKSVTAKTKQEALRRAYQYKAPDFEDMTLQEACRTYLATRGPQLSPSTRRGYTGTLRTVVQPDPLGSVKISKIKTRDLQAWVSRVPGKRKTKINHLGFVISVIRYFDENASFRVRIAPEIEAEPMYTPTVEELNRVIALASPELRVVIGLGMHGLRRGEICALDASDLDRSTNLVRISKSVAKDPDGRWIVKTPKTRQSVRWVEITPEVMKMLPDEGPVVRMNPDAVTNAFSRCVRRAGTPHFRLHDLRSFYASLALSSAVGVSRTTVKRNNGWASDVVMLRNYDRPLEDQVQRETKKMLSYLEDVIKWA